MLIHFQEICKIYFRHVYNYIYISKCDASLKRKKKRVSLWGGDDTYNQPIPVSMQWRVSSYFIHMAHRGVLKNWVPWSRNWFVWKHPWIDLLDKIYRLGKKLDVWSNLMASLKCLKYLNSECFDHYKLVGG